MILAENDDSNTGKPKLDASDLRAKLGLAGKKAPPPPAPKVERAVVGPEPVPAPAPVVARPTQPSAESIDEARRKAAEAHAEAGPAVEEFSVAGNDRTPLPAALPSEGVRVEYVSVGAADSYPGQDRKRRILLVAVALFVGGVAFVLGSMLSGSSARNELRDSYVREAREKESLLKANKDNVARIVELKTKLREALVKIREVTNDPKADPAALEPVFNGLVPILAAYEKDKVFIDPGPVMGDTMFNGTLMQEVVGFAVQTVLLHNAVSDGLGEIRGYMRMSAPPQATTRSILIERGEREVEGVGSLPISTGEWIKDAGPPQQIDLVDSTTGQPVGKEWQLKVLVVGEEEPRQVATHQVMQLDLKPIFDERTEFAKRVSFERLAQIVEKLDKVATGVNPEAVIKSVQEWASKEL